MTGKHEITMFVTDNSGTIRAEFTTETQELAEAAAYFLRSRLAEMNLGNTLEFSGTADDQGTYHISVTVPDKKILKEMLNGKALDFGALYATAFPEKLRRCYSDAALRDNEELRIVFSEPQKLHIINDNVKLSKFLLAIAFATCGVGVSFYGITLFNLNIIPAVLGKNAGLILPAAGLACFSLFCKIFNQPGGRR